MSPWRWWVGTAAEVDDEGRFDLGDFGTRDAAIAAGQRDTPVGEAFYIIEARTSDAREHEGSDFVPFLRFKNRERLVNGPQRSEGAE